MDFNVYFGLKDKGWKRYYWLNLKKLAEKILKNDQTLVTVKYFTSRVSSPPNKVKRQGNFIEALETLSNIETYYGKYQSNPFTCSKCRQVSKIQNEKMTDVNIAVEMLADAHQNKFDTAILISADSDLKATIQKVLELFPEKRVTVAFPPSRFSFELSKIATASFTIGRKRISESIFEDEVLKSEGYKLVKPLEWN
jgi:uncharacterized LabA/DUF88 family protein